MNSQDREYVAAVINYFWRGLAQPHTVNEKAAKVMYEALAEAQSCTASIDLVPRPTYTPGISWIVKEVAKIGKRIMSGDASVYNMCRDRVAANYRSFIEAALLGL
ncbi:hypothetical protein EZI54_16120 [Marinobacter halodurans]|uniref:Uncharacterized protein n=1 Tax=Marinobacter halodurans TaxID=2528979 RepID=A0ABY1ZK73_9GAMM|nr:hypothetical protein [Marinobacter halodurans]TBW52566.1 hypothetical protein EZI54_16120 [Marinobacter halodurans]